MLTLENPLPDSPVLDPAIYRHIDVSNFDLGRIGNTEPITHSKPIFAWIDIDNLVIDNRYQRNILDKGKANVFRIYRKFNWSKFTPVIVSYIEGIGDKYAIVDGQHRTTAAKLRGIKSVPCMIVRLTAAEQAESFAAINNNVTKITPLQLYSAQLASGDPDTIVYRDLLERCGVVVVKYPIPLKQLKKGQTLAVTQLRSLLRIYGEDIFELALRCITETGNGNPGHIRPAVAKALCINIRDRMEIVRYPEVTIGKLNEHKFNLTKVCDEARLDAAKENISETEAISAILTDTFYDVFGAIITK